MSYQEQILQRIAWLRAELDALAHLVEVSASGAVVLPAPSAPSVPAAPAPSEAAPEPVEEAAPEPVTPAPAPVAKAASKAPAKKVRWSYLPGTFYRLIGPNPFRNGNNYNLFAYLEKAFGEKPFSREQLSEAIDDLAAKGRINTKQKEDTFVMIFLRGAGVLKDSVEMCPAPKGGAVTPTEPEDLPPEPGEVNWKLKGKANFRETSINGVLWKALGKKTFSRDDLTKLATKLKKDGTISSSRDATIIARDFLGVVADKDLVEKA